MQFSKHLRVSILLLLVTGMTYQPSTAESKKHKPATQMLIPPPPPTVPLAGQYSQIYSTDPQFMSAGDLKHRQKELAEELAIARRQAGEQDLRLKAKTEKSKLFGSLYAEGVISRRELETAQDDASSYAVDNQDTHHKLSSLETEMSRIENRLKELSAADKKHNAKPTVKVVKNLDKKTK